MARTIRYIRRLAAALAILSLYFITPVLAQLAPSASTSRNAPSSFANAATSTPLDTTQIAVLRAQLAAEKQHNEAVLATVYWSLGVTGGIFVLLLGFGWFVNFRVYDRDKELLSEQLQRELEHRLAAFASESRERIHAETVQLTGRFDQLRGDLSAYLANALEARARVSEGSLRTLQHRQREAALELLVLKARFEVSKRHFGNAFSHFVAAARIAEEREIPSKVNEILAELEAAVDACGKLFSSDVNKLSEFLGRVVSADSVLVERLRAKLATAERFVP